MMKPARAATRRFLPTSPFNAPPAAPPVGQFAVQDQVTHDTYGLGRVIGVEDDTVLVIDFQSCQKNIARVIVVTVDQVRSEALEGNNSSVRRKDRAR